MTVLRFGSISRSENKPETSFCSGGTESVRFDFVSAFLSATSSISPRGFEPLTFGSGGQRSIQLSYGDENTRTSQPRAFLPSSRPPVKPSNRQIGLGHPSGVNFRQPYGVLRVVESQHSPDTFPTTTDWPGRGSNARFGTGEALRVLGFGHRLTARECSRACPRRLSGRCGDLDCPAGDDRRIRNPGSPASQA